MHEFCTCDLNLLASKLIRLFHYIDQYHHKSIQMDVFFRSSCYWPCGYYFNSRNIV